jgi:hypothetical protein
MGQHRDALRAKARRRREDKRKKEEKRVSLLLRYRREISDRFGFGLVFPVDSRVLRALMQKEAAE